MLPLFLSVCAVLAGVAKSSSASAHYSVKYHAPASDSTFPTLPLPRAPFSAPIVARTARRASKTHALHSLRAGKGYTPPLDGADYDYEYLTKIIIGGQSFSVIVDTGSSDTWLAEKGFSCFNLSGAPAPIASCGFGTEGFDTKLSKSFQWYPNTSFAVQYGDGESLSGTAAFETVNVGGLTVKHQEIGVVSNASWAGDGINTGLLGLAYPWLTSVTSTAGKKLQYNPFFFNAVKQRQVAHPYFSLALNRGTPSGQHSPSVDPHLGYLAFGGIAQVPVTSAHATVPVQGYSLATRAPTNRHPTYFYYTVDVQKYVFPGSTAVFTASNSTIIDSGTTLNLVPTDVARAYNKAFNATWRAGTYYVECAAKAPPFSVLLGGKTFAIDPRDQVVYAGTDDSGAAVCISGTQDGGPVTMGSVFILGDVFMHNVVTTFDIQRNQITFTQRKPY
ncbi:aspartic peptidase domain-containing protein [Mycena filopes]|nr:aspartic peptidase domain-containing protein [Mycena filopes]